MRKKAWLAGIALVVIVTCAVYVMRNSRPAGLDTMMKGHDGWVRCMAFSADGELLATGSKDHTLRLWNIARKEQQLVLRGVAEIRSVSFSPDTKLLATGSADGAVVIWNVGDGRKVVTLLGGDSRTHDDIAVAFAPDGENFAASCGDGNVHLWDVLTWRRRASLRADRAIQAVWSLAFSQDGSFLASACNNNYIDIWDADKLQLKKTLHDDNHTGSTSPTVVALHPNGRELAVGGWYKKTGIWDIESEAQRVVASVSHPALDIAFSQDGTLLAAAFEDNTIKLWDVVSGKQVGTIRTRAFAIAFHPRAGILATGGSDGTVRLWDLAAIKTND